MRDLRVFNKEPLFSILIANYNNGSFLEECIDSIITQTYSRWEIILVDDASTDNSSEIYKKYSGDSRIKIKFNKKNRGCGYTKKKCVALASGDICGFVDADDVLEKEAISVMVHLHLEMPETSIIYSTHTICDEKLVPLEIAGYVDQIPNGKSSWNLVTPVISHFATFKKYNYSKTKGISSFFKKAADKDLYYKLEETGSVYFINKVLYHYRHHSGSISLNSNSLAAFQFDMLARSLALLRSNKKSLDLESIEIKSLQLNYGVLKLAISKFKKGEVWPAINFWFVAFQLSPANTLKFTLKGF